MVLIEEFKPVTRNTLRGFARVRLGNWLVLHEVAVHSNGGSAWASPPGKPKLDRDGVAIKDGAGKLQYAQIVDFPDRQTRDRFSRAVVEAVRAQFPEMLP